MSTPKTNDFFYQIVVTALRLFFYGCFRLRVAGAENIPRRGGCLIATNHRSYLDPMLLSVASTRHLCFMAKQDLFRGGLFEWVIRNLNAFPVQRQSADLRALRQALALLASGRSLIVFPEGTRSLDGTLGNAEPGIALLAAKAGVPVVPGFLSGTADVMPVGEKEFKMGKKLRVRFGKPLQFSESGLAPGRAGFQEFADRVRAAIAALEQEERSAASSRA